MVTCRNGARKNSYNSIATWARMVSEAGTLYPPDVIKQYEKGETFDSLVGGLAPELTDTSFTVLPSRPLVTLGAIFLISSLPSFRCSTASCQPLSSSAGIGVSAGQRHRGADGHGRAF